MTNRYDLRPLEFASGRNAILEMMKNDLEVGEFWSKILRVYLESPHMFARGASDVDFEIAGRVSDAFFNMMSRAPLELIARYDSVMSDVRRFGTWDAMVVNGNDEASSGVSRLKFRTGMSAEQAHDLYGLMGRDTRIKAHRVDDKLIMKLYRLTFGSPGMTFYAQADIQNGYVVVEPPREGFSRGEQTCVEFDSIFGKRRPQTIGFSMYYPTCGGDLVVTCSRHNPIFNLFEPYATSVSVDQYNAITIRVGKELRDVGTPMIHKFGSKAEKALAPDSRPLWRMEIPIAHNFTAGDVIGLLDKKRSHYVSNGERMFVEGGMRCYDIACDRYELDRDLARGTFPEDVLGVMTVGSDSQMALAGAFGMIGICCPTA